MNASSPFDDLKKYTTIIFYTETNPIPKEFSMKCIEPVITLNLSVDKDLENEIRKYYNIEKLPAMLIGNKMYYSNSNGRIIDISTDKVEIKVNNLLKENKNLIFIKGTPLRPECGFTRQLIELLSNLGLESGRDYAYFNIFEDQVLREEMKKINKWPTYPQIYLKGEFIGGLDCLREMIDDKSIDNYIDK